MNIIPKHPSIKGPTDMFSGDVYFDVIAKGESPSRLRVNSVHFAPCARTAWHCHASGQTLHVTEGVGLVQSRGGDVIERCVPATPSTHRRANGTGMGPLLTTS